MINPFVLLISVILVLFFILLSKLNKIIREVNINNAKKRDILLMVSHDLTSPLSALDQANKIVQEHLKAGEITEANNLLKFYGQSLTKINFEVENIVDWLKHDFEQNKFYSLNEIIQEVHNFVIMYAKSKNVAIELEIHNPDILKIDFDRGHSIGVVMRNIVSNIIKHSNAKKITLGLEKDEQGWFLSIKDNADPVDSIYCDKLNAIKTQKEDSDNYSMSGIGTMLIQKFIHKGKLLLDVYREEFGNTYLIRGKS